MHHSYVTLGAARKAGLAVGHRYWFGLATPHGPTFRPGIQSAGYLISSAEDMARYLALYVNHGIAPDGRRIVSRRGLRTMLAPGREATMGPWSDHAEARYAMGWYVGGPWSEPALLHPGRSPDSSSLIVVFPRRELAVVTLTNAANQLRRAGLPGVDRPPSSATPSTRSPASGSTRGPPCTGFYLYFDLAALALLAAAAWSTVRALRALRARARPRRVGLAVAGVVARAAVGALLVALPAVTLGTRTWFLWQPDLSAVLVVLGGLLLLGAALRLAQVVRGARTTPGRPAETAVRDRPREPAVL